MSLINCTVGKFVRFCSALRGTGNNEYHWQYPPPSVSVFLKKTVHKLPVYFSEWQSFKEGDRNNSNCGGKGSNARRERKKLQKEPKLELFSRQRKKDSEREV
ncbi:hypothetical protein BaRGS_00023261 [Batillaria attramentaria]|uniref:Uncharacterized protein n=1 Tax=Batillaria attramentaria TaxID=370345 RepID=A0ABD0KEJ9_9CAEN